MDRGKNLLKRKTEHSKEAPGTSKKTRKEEKEQLKRDAAAKKAEGALIELGAVLKTDLPVTTVAETMKKFNPEVKANFLAWIEMEHISESQKTDLTKEWFEDVSESHGSSTKESDLMAPESPGSSTEESHPMVSESHGSSTKESDLMAPESPGSSTEESHPMVSESHGSRTKEGCLVSNIEARLISYGTRFRKELLEAAAKELHVDVKHLPAKLLTKMNGMCRKIGDYIEENKRARATFFIDRSEMKGKGVCDENGRIKCAGLFEDRGIWKSEACKHPHHTVNPYGTATMLAVFCRSYNMDHSIAIRDLSGVAAHQLILRKEVNHVDVAELLISPKFLKFVHVKCHSHATRIYRLQDDTEIKEDEILSLPSSSF